MSKSKTTVIEMDYEDISNEHPLAKVIETTLVKNNVTDRVIAELETKYGGLRLKSIDDKESYLQIKESRAIVRKVGIAVERLCKAGREDAIKTQQLWLSKQKEVLAKVAKVQDPLDAEIERFEAEVERKETEERNRREHQFMQRQEQLIKLGASFSNGHFISNEIEYEVEILKQADEEMWTGIILPKYQCVFDEKQVELVAEEAKRKAEIEAQRKQQEEFELQQKQFREQQEELRIMKAELDAEKLRVERESASRKEQEESKERQAKEEASQKAIAAREARTNARLDELMSLGMTYSPQYGAYVYRDVNIDVMTELKLWNDEEWKAAIEKITPVIALRKKEDEERRLAEVEKEKQKAIDAALKLEKEQNELAEIRRQEELVAANDKTKWEDFLAQINALTHIEMKSPSYRKKQAIAKEKLEEIINL